MTPTSTENTNVTGGESWSEFRFDREAAAKAAWALSRKGVQGLGFEPDVSPYSAIFMSLAYYAGGIPMTIPSGTEKWYDLNELEHGWRAVVYGSTLSGNSVWNNHNLGSDIYDPNLYPSTDRRLIGYLTGSSSPRQGIDVITSPSSIAIGPISVAGVAGPGAVDFDRVLTLATSSLAGVQQGDYLFIDSQGDTHGYMVVGYGPAVACDTAIASQVNMSLVGNRVFVDAPAIFDHLVPYVADWSGRMPRSTIPFYCSRSQFTHNNWTFVTIPDNWQVKDSALYTTNFVVTQEGEIIVNTNG
jgi:hypothetical protein